MCVFRFELKQYKTSIIIWALSLSLAIMFLLPMFSGIMTEDKSSVVSSLQDNPMMDAMGISAENFSAHSECTLFERLPNARRQYSCYQSRSVDYNQRAYAKYRRFLNDKAI